MPKPSEMLPKFLLAAMQRKKFKQVDLARTSGVPQSHISNYLSGKGSPSIDTLAALAASLGVSCDALLGFAPIPQQCGPSKEDILKRLADFADSLGGLWPANDSLQKM